MRGFFTHILDFIFPPSKETLELRALSRADLFEKLPRANFSPHPFITSLFAYKNPLVAELIWSIKYKKDRHAIELGSYALYRALEKRDAAVLIPIPVSKKRRNERGYNQCEVLVGGILALDKENKFEQRFDILFRTRHMERQTLKNRKERMENMERIFHAEKVPLNAPIILIDDVVTTGSTLQEVRNTLIRAGYENVSALTLAH